MENNIFEIRKDTNNKLNKRNIISIILIFLIILVIVLESIIFYNYKTMPYIKLIGLEEIEHEVGKKYIDQGYKKIKDENITVVAENLVDYNNVGDYNYIYKVTTKGNKTITYKRKVKVVDNIPPNINVDVDKLILTLGEEINESYIINELNIIITDNYDDISKLSFRLDYSNVINDTAGEYKMKIIAEDSNKNISKKEINVTVKELKVEDIILNKDSLTLYEGENSTLIAYVLPVNVKDTSIYWYSENENVATVNQNGKVSSKIEGITRICARSNLDTSVKKCININVKNRPISNNISSSNSSSNNSNNTNTSTEHNITITKCEYSYASFTHTGRIDASIRNDSSISYDFVRVKFYTLDSAGNIIDTRVSNATSANFAPGDVVQVWIPTGASSTYGAKCVIDGYWKK